MDIKDLRDFNDARLIARAAQQRQGLEWDEHPLVQEPDEIWRFDDGAPGFVYLDDPVRCFAMRRHSDPRDDVLVEKASVTPGDYLSVYSRSGERLDLAFVLTRKNDEARG